MFEIIPIERRNRHATTYDPFREMEEFERRFWGNSSMTTAFRTDVEDTGDAFKLEAELPGFDKEDIQLDLDNDTLTITAEHNSDKKEEDKKGRILRQERYAGVCSRSFYVGNVKPEDVKAKYESGVLSVVLPKVDQKKLASASKIAIE